MTHLIGCPLDFQPGSNSKKVRTWFFQSQKSNCPHHKGVFGHVTAAFGGIETQARGALHFHLLIWGSIPPKVLQQAAFIPEACKKVSAALDHIFTAALPPEKHIKDMMLRAMKETANGPKLLPKSSKIYSTMKDIPSPMNASQQEWKAYFWEHILKTGIHEHTFTCKKPPQGRHRCRGCRPAGDSTETWPHFLQVEGGINSENFKDKKLVQIMPTIMEEPPEPRWQNATTKCQRDFRKEPIPIEDQEELFMWELKRPLLDTLPSLPEHVQQAYDAHLEVQAGTAEQPSHLTNMAEVLFAGKSFVVEQLTASIDPIHDGEDAGPNFRKWLDSMESHVVIALYLKFCEELKVRNGMVVETNETLQLATGASTNAILLGSSQQSRAALFYVAPYVCKNKVALESCLTALEIAQRHIEEHPSCAEDSGTAKRTIQHLFTRVLNALSRSVEISDTQAALYLLNMGSEITSDSFRFFGAHHCVNYFLNSLQQQQDDSVPNLVSTDAIPEDTEESILDFCAEETMQTAPATGPAPVSKTTPVQMDTTASSCTKLDFGPAFFYTVKDDDDDEKSSSEVDADTTSSHADDDSSAAPAPRKQKKKKIAVHYPTHWWYRGKELCKLTQYEYHSMVDVLPYSWTDQLNMELEQLGNQPDEEDNDDHPVADADLTVDNTDDIGDADGDDEANEDEDHQEPGKNTRQTSGSKKRKAFLFHPSHPLHHSHAQFLRAKQHTLIFNAKSRAPKHPGSPPEPPKNDAPSVIQQTYQDDMVSWKTKASAFATYCSILFLPQEDLYGQSLTSQQNEEGISLGELDSNDDATGASNDSDLQPATIPDISWEAFCTKIQEMECSPKAIDHVRLEALMMHLTGMECNHVKRILLNNYRHRNSTRWTEEEKQEADLLYRSIGDHKKRSKDGINIEDYLNERVFTSTVLNNNRREDAFRNKQMAAIRTLFPTPENPCRNSTSGECNSPAYPIDKVLHARPQPSQLEASSRALRTQVVDVSKVADDIRTATLKQSPTQQLDESDDDQLPVCPPPPDPAILQHRKLEAEAFLKKRNLLGDQKEVVNHMLQYFLQVAKHKHKYRDAHDLFVGLHQEGIQAPHLLVTGEPGAGKSYAVDSISELPAILCIGKVAGSSYNGIAAVNIDGGTICKMFSIFDTSENAVNIDDDKIRLLKQALDSGELCCIIIDEVSTIDARIIALLNYRLQNIMGNTLDFGGLPIIFVGDFCQLGPVQKVFLPSSMMTWAIRLYHKQSAASKTKSIPKKAQCSPKPSSKSVPTKRPAKTMPKKRKSKASLMSSAFKRQCIQKYKSVKKSAQQKTADDAKKCKPGSLTYIGCSLLSKFHHFHLSEQMRSKDPEHTDFVQHLSHGNKIEVPVILTYKKITKDDIETPGGEWMFAPILVATNQERLNISRMKASLWAQQHQTYVFKWKCKDGRYCNKPSGDSFKDKHAFFYQYFVAGADAYLNNNINAEIALVNGSPVKLHSLTLHDSDTVESIIEQAKMNHIPYGSEIEIDEPLAVNVSIVQKLHGKEPSKKRKKQLQVLRTLSRKYSIDPKSRDIILPLTTSMSDTEWQKFTFLTGNLISPVAQVHIREPFPFDLAFAMTVHKAQGRTIHRVIIDLTDHPFEICRMKYAAIFVAMSRVEMKDHLRLLEPNTVQSRESLYQYLETLKPEPNIAPFLHGYTANNAAWDPNLALTYKTAH